MSYLADYNYDVFISYSMSSDALSLDQEPWVSRFHDLLRTVVIQKLTESGKEIDLFYAARTHQAGDKIQRCLDEVKASAILVILGSPRWVSDPWPNDELKTFLARFGDGGGRIFIAEIEPLPKGRQYPDALKDVIPIKFWRRTARDNPATMQESTGIFQDLLADLASPVARKLMELKDVPLKPLPQPNPNFRRVLLAQPTDDLAEQVQGLESALRQRGITVLRVPDSQPLDASFGPNFEALVDQSDIVVQLLSPYVGLRPPELPKGRQRTQADLVRARQGKALIQWRALDLDRNAIADPDHRALLWGDKVQESSIADFEAEIVRMATQPPPRPVQVGGHGNIFVSYDEVDRERARQVIDKCMANGRRFAQPLHGEDTKSVWRENYKSAAKVVILHEKSRGGWVGAQMRLYDMATAKGGAPEVKILWLGPPPKDPGGLPVGNPDFEIVKSDTGDLDELYRKIF